MDGRGYLEKIIADRLSAGAAKSSLNLFEIRGVAIGLVAAGALRQDEAEHILADLEATLRSAGWLHIVRQEASAPGRVSATARPVGTERVEWRRAIEDPPIPELLGVIPLAGRVVAIADVTTHLVSLEVWSTQLLLRQAYRLDGHTGGMHRPLGLDVRWRGWDDAGTQYQGGSGGGGSGAHGWAFEQRVFVPGPPDHATVITFVVEHSRGQVTIPVQLPAHT